RLRWTSTAAAWSSIAAATASRSTIVAASNTHPLTEPRARPSAGLSPFLASELQAVHQAIPSVPSRSGERFGPQPDNLIRPKLEPLPPPHPEIAEQVGVGSGRRPHIDL